MAIELPQPRLPRSAVPKLLDWGSDQKAPQGGSFQRLNRLGNRFALELAYPRLKPEPDGRILASRLRRAKTEGALFPFPQPGLAIGNPGAPVVDGAGQSGSMLALRGFTPGYRVREGQFFSIIDGGRRYLHEAAAETIADAGGRLVLAINPMLRIRPGNAAICEFAKPYIEGIVSGSSMDVELTIAKSQVPTILIIERA